MTILAICVLLCFHFWVLVQLKIGVQKVVITPTLSAPTTNISVVIPFRNESKNIDKLVSTLNNQSIESSFVEFIFINDHSEDDSFEKIELLLKTNFKFPWKLLALSSERGKKQALLLGISNAKYEKIVQLDADAFPKKNWLPLIQNHLAADVDLLILPVNVDQNNSHWFQQLEFSALQFITFGMGGLGHPILANGANLAYDKSQWLLAYKDIVVGDSGDDIFLLQSFLKKGLTIRLLYGKDVLVTTVPVKTFEDFLAQRIRWAGKNSQVRIPKYTRTMLYFGFFNVLVLFALFFDVRYFLFILIGKSLVEFIFIRTFRNLVQVKTNLFFFILSAVLMPFYLLFMAIAGIIIQPKWKGIKVAR